MVSRDDGEIIGAFGSGFCSVIFDKDTLGPRIKGGAVRVNRAIDAVFGFYAPQVESAAKINAPWEDQTGNARNGLRALAGRDGDTHYLALFHQVPYGIFLEVRFSGRYAVIMPTLEQFEPRIIGDLNGLLGKDIFR